MSTSTAAVPSLRPRLGQEVTRTDRSTPSSGDRGLAAAMVATPWR